MYEAQLAQLAQQTFNMQSAAIATENLQNTMATVDAMKLANKEIKKQYGKIDIDKIEVRGAFCRTPVCPVLSCWTVEHALRHGGIVGAGQRNTGVSREILCST